MRRWALLVAVLSVCCVGQDCLGSPVRTVGLCSSSRLEDGPC
jgi:hypothetical protein